MRRRRAYHLSCAENHRRGRGEVAGEARQSLASAVRSATVILLLPALSQDVAGEQRRRSHPNGGCYKRGLSGETCRTSPRNSELRVHLCGRFVRRHQMLLGFQ